MCIRRLALKMAVAVPIILSLSAPVFSQDDTAWQEAMQRQADFDAQQQAQAEQSRAAAERDAAQQAFFDQLRASQNP